MFGAGAAGGLGAGEAAGAAAGDVAAGAAPALADVGAAAPGAFLLPGTDTAIAGGVGGGSFAFPEAAAAGLSAGGAAPGSFLVPGTDTPITGGPVTGGGSFQFPTTAGALPSATQLTGTAGPGSDVVLGPQGATDSFMGALSSVNPAESAFGAAGPAGVASGAAPAADPATFFVPGTDTPITGDIAGAGTFSDATGGGIGSDIWDFVKKNPGLALAVPGLGAAMLMNRGAIPGQGPVQQTASTAQGMSQTAQQNAGQLMAQASGNLNAPVTGALPPGAADAINNAATAAKAQVRSSFAAMGIPAGSTMEHEQLASIDQNTAAQRMKASLDLAHLGVSEAGAATAQGGLALSELGLTNQDMLALMNARIQQDAALQQALARFAGAAAGPAIGSAIRPPDQTSSLAAA